MALEYLIHPRPTGSVALDTIPAEVAHPAVQELRSYWEARLDADGYFDRTSLEPKDIAHLLPQLFIAESDGGAWRFRLLGTGLCRRFGRDVTGHTVAEVFGSDVAATADADYRAVIASGAPNTFRIRYFDPGKPDGISDALYVPLRARTGSMMILGGVFFTDASYMRSRELKGV